MAFFGAGGDVLFVGREKANIFIYRVKDDGSELPKVVPAPLFRGRQLDFTGGVPSVSSDGKWVVVQGGIERGWGAVVVYPVSGGTPTLVCGACAEAPNFERGFQTHYVDWTPDGKFLYLNFQRVRLCDSSTARPDLAARSGVRISNERKRWLLCQERG